MTTRLRRDSAGRRSTLWSIPVAAILAVTLGACAAGGPAATTTPDPGSTAASVTATETNAPDTPKEPLTGAECIVGSWLLDNDSFADLVSSYEASVIDEVTGIARFTASADGSAVTEYIDWTNTVRMTDPEGVVTMVRNGKDSGVYNVESDGSMSLTEQVNDSVIVVEMTSLGITMPMPKVENSPGALHLAVFSCTGDELTVTVEGRSSVMTRES